MPFDLKIMRWFTALASSVICLAQEPVSVGSGSYSSTPPIGKMVDKKTGVDAVDAVEKQPLYLVKDDGRAIPSNEWFQNLLLKQFGTGLWAMPHRVDATKEGIEIFQVKAFSGDGVRAIPEFPLVITGRDFKPQDSRVKDWSDWAVSFRSFENETRFIDVTLGEGMPAVWCEFTGIQPIIALGGLPGKSTRGKKAAAFFNLAGDSATLPTTGDTLGLEYEGRVFGIFAPDGTKFEQSDAGIEVAFSGKSRFLVVCPLSDAKDLAFFHKHAFAIPRDTQLSWKYDRAAGSISTTWQVVTEPLKPGADKGVVQGFLPHHWRENTTPLALTGPTFTTIRGAMKCATGNTFTITYPFHGILPNFPAPTGDRFDASRIKELLASHFTDSKKPFRGDTYWAGKELERYAQAAFIAAQTKDPSLDAVLGKLRSALENWFTFSSDEKEQFFAYYPRRKGLVGFPAAFGSEHFTDTHFHQGYFVYAAGLLCQLQPDFAAKYGDFARLIAKNYANYDRKETRFPSFRTFDLWRGHSFADGNGFPDGNNQESTGEAVNSWVGMILLGEALGDEELTAAGVMGYSFETRANVEYWFDPHDDVFPKTYLHNACGMIWCGSIVWGTWFTASPAWIYGIQWLPSAPHMAFYDRQPEFIKNTYADVERELTSFEAKESAKKPGTNPKAVEIKTLGGELGSYHLGFIMQGDPQRAVAEFDKLWSEPGDKVAHNEWMMNIYYQASALAELGRVDWSAHGTTPTSMVYTNPAKKTRTLLAWNPTAKAQTVQFFQGSKAIGTLTVPPHSIASGLAK
jgi:endoglucanase Acf2